MSVVQVKESWLSITYYDVISEERRWVEGEGQVKAGILISRRDVWEDRYALN